MSQISQLLIYQEKDSQLLKIEQEIAGSEERKNYAKARSFMKKAGEKLDQLEAKSKEILNHLDAIEQKYKEVSETLKDFDHMEEIIRGGADVSFYQRSASQLIEELKTLKGEISGLMTAAKSTTDEYQNLKKQVLAAQKQYPELEAAYKNLKKQREGETSGIVKELTELSKGIDADVLKKYQAKRSERIFPIICEIRENRCSKCGIELSIAAKEKAAAGNVVECENCHRFLYKKEK